MKTHLTYGREIVTSLPFAFVVERAKEALRSEGFGVLCEIDVARTFREKIGAEFQPYVILGACNPQLAYNALAAEPHLGLLLPCNVVVSQDGANVKVAAIDAKAMLGLVGNPALDIIADDVNARLGHVLDQLS